nr:hypothetical protein [Desulfurobacterium thermolithotrophum]
MLDFKDLFDELSFLKKSSIKQYIPENFKEIYELLSRSPLSIDQIADKLDMDIPTLTTLLLEMEILGLVRKEGSIYTTL